MTDPQRADDLTREEIQASCEAVGWKRCSSAHQTWAEREEDETLFLVTDDPDEPGGVMVTCFNCDAFALLEAWRLQDPEHRWYQIDSPSDGSGTFGSDLVDGEESWEAWGTIFRAAAVRAVNAWARGRG